MADTRSELASTFESAADFYDEARPTYPDALFDDLVELAELKPGDRALEIGCATGKATRPLLERGLSVVCVEPGEKLAEAAKQNLAGYQAEVHVSPFEVWEPKRGEFDLVYAATAWHWIDPTVRYGKAHRLLRPGGHLAFWSALHAFPAGFDPFFTEIQDVYAAIGHRWDGPWPPSPPEELPDEAGAVETTGLFEDVKVRRYVWAKSYTADQYIALLGTFSGHIAMNPEDRNYLYREIRRRIDQRPDNQIRRHWYAIIHIARRASSPRKAAGSRLG